MFDNDTDDFAQEVPSAFTSLSPLQGGGGSEDWLTQLQVLDLPQLFSFNKDPISSSSSHLSSDEFLSSEELDDIVDFNSLNSLLDVVPPESQHDAPGPTRNTITKPDSLLNIDNNNNNNINKNNKVISISRDELLKFSSDDLEAYVKALSSSRPLTTAEHKEIKRQRRLIKNRESAQQSRKRKKDKVGDLEGQVSHLEGINEERKAKLDEIQAENVILRAEVSQLVNVIKDSPALSSLLLNVTSWMVMYTLGEAMKVQNIQHSLIPPLVQQKIQQFPASRAIC